jgi:hypothetical protein
LALVRPEAARARLRLMGEVYGIAFVNQRRYQGFPTAMTEDDFFMMDAGLRRQCRDPRESCCSDTLPRHLRGTVRFDDSAKRLRND